MNSDIIFFSKLCSGTNCGALQANVLTGLVNMSMYTIFVAPAKAFATVLLYALSLVGFMGLADAKKLRLKFW